MFHYLNNDTRGNSLRISQGYSNNNVFMTAETTNMQNIEPKAKLFTILVKFYLSKICHVKIADILSKNPDTRSTKIKTLKIISSLNLIKERINQYQTCHITIEDLTNNHKIKDNFEIGCHQILCELCRKKQIYANGLFDELIHLKLLHSNLRLRVLVPETYIEKNQILRIYIGINTAEVFPIFPQNYQLNAGSNEEARWRYLASICDDIFYNSQLVIHVLPGLNGDNLNSNWNIFRQKDHIEKSGHSNQQNKWSGGKIINNLKAKKEMYYHNKPIFLEFENDSLCLESDNEDDIED